MPASKELSPVENASLASRYLFWAGQATAWSLLLAVWIRNAWVCDDAYITFRTVEHFVLGYGLRFNVAERVQAYTHPLWMLLHVPFQAIWHAPYWATLVLSLACTLAALWKMGRSWQSQVGWLVLPAMAVASKAFVDFSSSGLENPLTFLLLAIFLTRWLRPDPGSKQLLHLCLIASALMLNRMDTILLVAPALAIEAWRQRPRRWGDWRAVGQVALGFLPLVIWEAFSTLYYGLPFPNTAYAKLGADIAQSELWRMGGYYFQDSISRDYVTLPVIALGLVLGCLQRKHLPLVAGVALYLLYVARIGGDFMTGRFFAAPFFVSLWVIGHTLQRRWIPASLLATLVTVAALLGSRPSLLSGRDCAPEKVSRDKHFITDERAYYYPGTGLLHALAGEEIPSEKFTAYGKMLSTSGSKVEMPGAIGITAYYAGPGVHFIDRFALADPLAARMPAIYSTEHRPGHFERPMVWGYFDSVLHDVNWVRDSCAYLWYEKVRQLTRDPIFDPDRLWLIWRLNMHLIHPCDLSYYSMLIDTTLHLPLPDSANFVLENSYGIRIELPPSLHSGHIGFRYDNPQGGSIFMTWFIDGQPDAARNINYPSPFEFEIPDGADAVAIYPETDRPHLISNLRVWSD